MNLDLNLLKEGLSNSIFIKDTVEQISKERTAICNSCEHHSRNAKKKGFAILRLDAFCTDCGCNIHLATRALAKGCPLGGEHSNFPKEQPKWLPLTDDLQLSEQLLEVPGYKEEITEYKIKLAQNKINDNGSD